ncbi:MAG: 23S rRNA (guanosine(2251)-2'-O)-methyltransferase RlmB [Flavobacteriales bacterium]|nr:23S rRNA (guanosine(2251)-2'-O)-methyltransferase RlmB [Flavobacteriales bacterium]
MNDMIFGIHPVLEAIQSGKQIDKIFIQNGLQGENIKNIKIAISKIDLRINYVPLEKLNRITRKNHQGVIAFLSAVELNSVESVVPHLFEQGKSPFLLILDRVTDVRNFGALVRTAECAGADAVIIGNVSNAPVNSDAMKTSAGALNHMTICKEENLPRTIDFLQQSGIKVFAATEKTDNLVYSQEMQKPLAIVMGSEENGISQEILKRCDARIKLPLFGKTESLNVSVACGAILYEVVRQNSDL